MNRKQLLAIGTAALLVGYSFFKLIPNSPLYIAQLLISLAFTVAIFGWGCMMVIEDERRSRLQKRVEMLERHNQLFHKIPGEEEEFDPSGMDTEPVDMTPTAREAWRKTRGAAQ